MPLLFINKQRAIVLFVLFVLFVDLCILLFVCLFVCLFVFVLCSARPVLFGVYRQLFHLRMN